MQSWLRVILPALWVFITISSTEAQQVIELGVKPAEWTFQNFEFNVGVGSLKQRYGVILAYRPSTQRSGAVEGFGHGIFGSYDKPHVNRLYNGHTLGLYHKRYLHTRNIFFIEADLFYRNWSFDKKHAEYENVEGYNFNALRSENIEVVCGKLLGGASWVFTQKVMKMKTFLEIYAGVGIRSRKVRYESFDGFIGGEYHHYLNEYFIHYLVSPQVEFRLGLLRVR